MLVWNITDFTWTKLFVENIFYFVFSFFLLAVVIEEKKTKFARTFWFEKEAAKLQNFNFA